MTENEAFGLMWKAKLKYEDCYLHATLVKPVEMHEWNGEHPVEENTETRTVAAGTRVIIVMVSRFGDAGIRDYDLDKTKPGYTARVEMSDLTDFSEIPA